MFFAVVAPSDILGFLSSQTEITRNCELTLAYENEIKPTPMKKAIVALGVEKMTVGDFFKRRLIRLQPMVVIGALIGAVMFYFQGCPVWDVSKISVTMLLVATLMNALLIPATPGSEIRGVTEMFPLNGPSWSLFYEYIGNILYALFIRRLPTKALAALVLLAGCGLAAFAVWGPYGDICAGFSLTGDNIAGGSLRLLFSFSAGLLMSRVFKPVRVRGAFWIGALGVVAVSAVPRIGGSEHLWMNGLYDAACAIAVFPLIVYLGASGKTTDKATTRICKFLGDISYPCTWYTILSYTCTTHGSRTRTSRSPSRCPEPRPSSSARSYWPICA